MWNKELGAKAVTNPYYCITVDPSHCEVHEPTISEDAFIASAVAQIKLIGAKNFIRNFLNALSLKRADVPEGSSVFMFSPYNCTTIHPSFCEEHDYLIPEEIFIDAGDKFIKDEGAKKYMRLIIQSLKGDFLSEEMLEKGKPDE